MKKQVVMSSKAGGTYSTTTAHAVKARGFVFVTGQVANRPGTDPLREPEKIGEMGTVEQQTVQVLENIKAILEDAGSSLDHVVKRNVYLTHVGDYPIVYKTMERYFSSSVASTGIIVSLIPVSARLEIDVIAALPD